MLKDSAFEDRAVLYARSNRVTEVMRRLVHVT